MSFGVIGGGNFLLSLLVSAFIQFSFFVGAVLTESEQLYDFAGGLNFVVVFLLTFAMGKEASNTRGLILTVLTGLSRAILAGFLLYRVLKRKGDARFDTARSNPLKFLLFWTIQMLWVFLVASPVIYVNAYGANPDLGSSDYAGFAMIAFGIIFQLVADLQKHQFRANNGNKGWACNVGVWKFSRHPNYFAEIVLWWGAFLVTIRPIDATGDILGLWTAVSPIFTMTLLLFVSGIPLAEGKHLRRFMKTKESKEAYLEYFNSVPPLIPFPPVCYSRFPSWAKRIFCFEHPSYRYNEKKDKYHQS